MKTHLILTIEPQDDGDCGKCPRKYDDTPDGHCRLMDENEMVRGEACYAAERKLRALLEAGDMMAHNNGGRREWYAAVAGIGEE